MATSIIRHKVKDYAAWRGLFDSFESTRKENGEQSYQVLQADGDPNDVIVINTWLSVDDANAFLAKDELKTAMADAGVIGPLDVTIANET